MAQNRNQAAAVEAAGAAGAGPATEQAPLPFKAGERIVLTTLPILRIEGDVAVLKKTRLVVEDGCGARHKVRVETPFMIRGGFRVNKTTKFKVPGWAFTVTFETPYGTYVTERVPPRNIYLEKKRSDAELAEELVRKEFGDKVQHVLDVKVNEPIKIVNVYTRHFRHAVVEIPEDDYYIHIRRLDNSEGETYFVYEFTEQGDAKLIDDVSRIDYVLHIFTHRLSSRSACAKMKVLGGDVVWQSIKNTCCAIESVAVAMIIARYGSRVAIAKNDAPYRGPEEWIVEEWESVFPPRLVAKYDTTEPVVTDLKPEEVV
jgi:hypothetical protein